MNPSAARAPPREETRMSQAAAMPRLPNGLEIVRGPLAYNADGLATQHNADFMRDPRFARAYAKGVDTIRSRRPQIEVGWRVQVCCWAAAHGAKLDGDFVECGVFTGIFSRAICEYLDFGTMSGRRFWLLDTFEGIVEAQLNEHERKLGVIRMNQKYGGDCSGEVRRSFAAFPNVHVVKGMVPETLAEVTSERIAYLSIDMNAAAPEIAALDFFWPRLIAGAVIVLDDYGWAPHIAQKHAFDAWAKRMSVGILPLPTGQGMIIKA
jgi:hypothetical protein